MGGGDGWRIRVDICGYVPSHLFVLHIEAHKLKRSARVGGGGGCTAENIKIILEGKATCRLHRNIMKAHFERRGGHLVGSGH